MSAFHGLAQRATAKLRRDRELRLEVSRELETHLEAAAAEFRAADYTEDDAHAAAVKAFGDPDDVAEALWDANRFRIRWRAWAWWAARLTLLPACVIATIIFIVSGLTTTTRLNEVSSGIGPHQEGLIAWQENRLKAKMTAEQRLIYFGDESSDDPIARWRAVRDANPDEVLDQLELISVMLSELVDDPADDPETFRTQRDALIKELARGEEIDPDNGIYALVRAGVWLRGNVVSDDPGGYVVVRTLKRSRGELEREDTQIYRWQADNDEAGLAEALPSLRIAADKPYISMHTCDRVRRRLAQLPPARSMQEYVMRVANEVSTLLPSLGPSRTTARLVSAEALRRAEAGDAAGANQLLDQLDATSAKLAASSDTLIALLVAVSIDAYARAARVAVWQALGDETQAVVAMQRSDALVHGWRNYWGEYQAGVDDDGEKLRTSGALMSTLIPAVPGYDVDTTPFRKAEYTLVDRGVLTGGMLVLIALSAVTSLVGVWGIWRKRKTDAAPVLLWIGWRRLGVVIAGAVLLPVLLFVMCSWTPWSGRGYGLNYSFAALIWYLPLVLGVGVMLWVLGRSALRRRALELGMGVPDKPGHGWTWVMSAGLAVVSTAVWGSFWWAENGTNISSLGWSIVNTVAILFAIFAATGWLASEIVWMRKVSPARSAMLRSAAVGSAVATGLGALLVAIVWFGLDRVDRLPLSIFVVCLAAVVGIVSALFWLAGRPGETEVFARSVLRSMGSVWAVAGLTLAITVGVGLNLRERTLARQMVERSPVWFDQEIEMSNARELRAYLAGEHPRPPRRP